MPKLARARLSGCTGRFIASKLFRKSALRREGSSCVGREDLLAVTARVRAPCAVALRFGRGGNGGGAGEFVRSLLSGREGRFVSPADSNDVAAGGTEAAAAGFGGNAAMLSGNATSRLLRGVP